MAALLTAIVLIASLREEVEAVIFPGVVCWFMTMKIELVRTLYMQGSTFAQAKTPCYLYSDKVRNNCIIKGVVLFKLFRHLGLQTKLKFEPKKTGRSVVKQLSSRTNINML